MSCKKLEGKVAIVTGGARGIGKSISKKLAEEGAAVAIVDVLLEIAEETVEEFKGQGFKAAAFKADVSSVEEVNETVKAVTGQFGRIDILVNNAGITKDTLLMRMTEQDWDAVMNINLKGTFNFTKAVIRPMMKAKGGKIVNIASVVGRMGNPGQANYSASKAGIIGFTKTVAKEFASRKICANAIAPGFIQTDMTKAISEDATDAFLSVIPLKRGGKPEDVANAVCFFCSNDSDYVTGQVLNVDGGMLM
ncbi:MAG: 3-oxoacyl-[acyl-carrier-protein] reductase [Victivallales bacterium]|nr:3-oxoacyl-[acyl-carrier-protein] reductase [Victivallales bacterium]MCF7889414.1 3-oxoacyl-[acyl-carrier-protein] reductase [Victivallales bacterium]